MLRLLTLWTIRIWYISWVHKLVRITVLLLNGMRTIWGKTSKNEVRNLKPRNLLLCEYVFRSFNISTYFSFDKIETNCSVISVWIIYYIIILGIRLNPKWYISRTIFYSAVVKYNISFIKNLKTFSLIHQHLFKTLNVPPVCVFFNGTIQNLTWVGGIWK